MRKMAAKESLVSGVGDLTLAATNFQTQPLRKFTIKLKNTVKSSRNASKSIVWDYFGDLWCNGINCDPGRNYCNLCLERAKEDARPNASFESFSIKKYQTNVSTSNYAWHLCRHHGINDTSRPQKNKSEIVPKQKKKTRPYKRRLQVTETTEETAAVIVPADVVTQATTAAGDNIDLITADGGAITVVVQKEPSVTELTNAIAVWFARDLIPLDNASGAGFKDFVRRFEVDPSAIGSPSQLKSDIVDIHTVLLGHVRYTLSKMAPTSGCLTVTKWGDVVGRYSYTSFTYHFLNEDFGFEHICLRVVSSLSPLSSENLAQEMQRSVHHFGVDKKLFVTREARDATVEAACQQMEVQSIVCIGRILDSLIITDGMNGIVELRDLLVKSHLVVSTLNLGAESLMTAIPEQFYHEAILEMGQLEDIFTAEGLVDSTKNNPNDAQTSSRWNVILRLLQTLIKHKPMVNVLLEQLQNVGDVAFDEDEWEALEGLYAFVSKFADAVEILSDTYPTLNLVLLFRSHLLLQLEEAKNDHPYVVHLKNLATTTFEQHFPVDSEAVLAALLDPRLRDLTVVSDYLATIKKDKAQFISGAIWKHGIVVDTTGTITTTSATDSILQLETNEGPTNAKRHRLSISELAKQHSGNVTVEKTDVIGDEINSLLTQSPESVVNDDILSFWNRKQEDWPILSALARSVLCIPATSAPYSVLFQHEGLLRASRFCSLNPAIVDKVVFVGENYPYFARGTTAI